MDSEFPRILFVLPSDTPVACAFAAHADSMPATAAHDELIDDAVDLVEVEDDVQFADVAEVLVEGLHEEVDELG